MQRDVPPPIGYFITDYESEIRSKCSFLEEKGMSYELVSSFEIRYVSDDLILSIVFERYGEIIGINYCLPKITGSEEYSVNWTLVEYKNGDLKKDYLSENMTKLEELNGYIQFFKDYQSLLLDDVFAKKTKEKYEQIGL